MKTHQCECKKSKKWKKHENKTNFDDNPSMWAQKVKKFKETPRADEFNEIAAMWAQKVLKNEENHGRMLSNSRNY